MHLSEELRRRGWLSALDVELARSLGRLVSETDDRVLLGVALASRQVREGHVCVDLARLASGPVVDTDGAPLGEARFPELSAWVDALRASDLVGTEGDERPLVLDGRSRLYLRRYFEHERRVAELLLERASDAQLPANTAPLRVALSSLFGERADPADLQRAAAMLAVLRRLTIVIGGPGTGKTSTVVKLLAMLAWGGEPHRVALLAPTGKAALRLADSVRVAKSRLPLPPDVARALPEDAATIHRALRPVGNDGTRFRHGPSEPLPVDVVVVDEASMVDIALMRRLLDAVPLSARLILLGDADQLVSVEAGAVLSDVCAGVRRARPSARLGARALEVFGEPLPALAAGTVPPLADSVIELQVSHRFDPKSGIGAVANATRRGDAELALASMRSRDSVAALVEVSEAALPAALSLAMVRGYSAFLGARSAASALELLESFRVLCAHRRGPRGVEVVNALAERALADAGLLALGGSVGRHYAGRPVLITENDYQLGLFNGDVGVIWPDASGALRAHFPGPEGTIRELSPARLPPHETVFAMSIHKSQGSELDEVAVVLPEASSPLASRELFYTAVTRARKRVVVYGSSLALERCIGRRVQRASGLADALWGDLGTALDA